MALPTLLIAGLLIALGAVSYTLSESKSFTAFIPSVVGLLIGLCGLLALKESLRKHAMHAAALLGLLGFVGGLMRPGMQLAKGESIDWGSLKVVTQLGMAGLCLIFVLLCINSFIQVRRARARSGA